MPDVRHCLSPISVCYQRSMLLWRSSLIQCTLTVPGRLGFTFDSSLSLLTTNLLLSLAIFTSIILQALSLLFPSPLSAKLLVHAVVLKCLVLNDHRNLLSVLPISHIHLRIFNIWLGTSTFILTTLINHVLPLFKSLPWLSLLSRVELNTCSSG